MKFRNLFPKKNRRSVWNVFAVLIIGLTTTLAFSLYTWRESEAQIKHEYTLVCNEISSKISTKIQLYAQLLRFGSSFFAASDSVSRHDWKKYIEQSKLEGNLLGIQGVGFACIIQKENLQAHIRKIRNEGFPEYTVRPAGERDIYTSIIYLEPFEGRNLRAFGYDMLSEPIRRSAMEKARDQNLAALSGKVTLVQETGKDLQAGTLMYMPVYSNKMPVNTVEERRAAIIGWVYSPYRMSDLMSGILGRWDIIDNTRIHLQIYDNGEISAKSLLFDSQSNNQLDLACRNFTKTIDFNGRTWLLVFAQSEIQAPFFQNKVALVSLAGIAISFLMFGLFLSLMHTKSRAEEIALQLTKQIKESEKRFSIFMDYLPAIVFLKDKNARTLYVNKYLDNAVGASEWIGKTMREILPGEFGEKIYADDLKVMELGIFKTEESIIHNDGKLHHYETQKFILPTEESEFLLGGVSVDITERKEAEDKLRWNESFLKLMTNTSPLAFFVVDNRTDKILYFNHQFCVIWGITHLEAEMQKGTYTNNQIIPDCLPALADIPAFAESCKPLQSEDNRITIEDYIPFVDGRTIRRFSSQMRGEADEYFGRFYIFEDVTQRIQAEEHIRKLSSEFQVILNTVSAGISHIKDRKVVWANAGHDAMFGYKTGDSKGVSTANYYSDIDSFNAFGQRAYPRLVSGNTFTEELQMCKKDGSLFWCSLTGSLVDNTNPNEGSIWMIQDISQRKRAEAVITEMQDNLSRILREQSIILETAPFGISMIIDRKQIWVNEAMAQMFGYTKDEMIGNTTRNLYATDEEYNQLGQHAYSTLSTGRTYETVQDLISRDGSHKLIRYIGKAVNPNDLTQGTIWLLEDITARKRAENALIESEARFKNMFAHHNSIMLLIESETGNIIDANLAASNFYGYSIGELCGMSINHLNTLSPEKTAAERAKAVHEKRNYFVFPHKLASGVIRTVEVHSSPISYEGGKILFSIIHDITERLRAEAEILVINQQLTKVNADKDRFLSIIGHDLRSPFTSILGFLGLLVKNIRKYDIDKIEKQVFLVHDSAQSVFVLLEDILTWARAQAGKIPFDPKKTNFSAICEDIVANLKLSADNKDIKISYFSVREISIFADLNMLKTILRNLVSNAIKFTNVGGRISIYAERNHTEITITVSDTGIGIKPQNLPKLFDISQTHTTEGTAQEKGTGLGLLLCQEFVHRHGGKIWVDSIEGKGSDFKFTLPNT